MKSESERSPLLAPSILKSRSFWPVFLSLDWRHEKIWAAARGFQFSPEGFAVLPDEYDVTLHPIIEDEKSTANLIAGKVPE